MPLPGKHKTLAEDQVEIPRAGSVEDVAAVIAIDARSGGDECELVEPPVDGRIINGSDADADVLTVTIESSTPGLTARVVAGMTTRSRSVQVCTSRGVRGTPNSHSSACRFQPARSAAAS